MKRKGSSIAGEIISEMKRAEYFKEYAKRKKRLIEKRKNGLIKYKEFEDKEYWY